MIRRLEQWADRNFKEVMMFLMGIMTGGCLVYVLQALGGVVCPEITVGGPMP